MLAVKPLPAQDALRYSLAGDIAAQQQKLEQESLPYTIKSGDLRLLITPSLGLDWNDNVNVSNQNPQRDEILRPMLRLDGSYPIGARNLLRLNVGVGYDFYFDHQNYSGIRVESGSQVAFDFFVKDFKFDIHDNFSYVQDPAGYAEVYGTAKYGSLQNTAGLSVDWDQEDLVVTLGYDHLNYFAITSQYEYTDHSSEMLVLRPGFRLHPTLTAGVEGTASFTTYDQHILNDYNNYSGGVYADWHPGKFISVQPRVGYTLYDYRQTSQFFLAENQTAWYVDLTLRHAITESITYSISAGHQLRPGIQADFIDAWYVRPGVSWSIIKNLSLNTGLSYEYGQQSSHGFSGAASEIYNWFTGNIGLGYTLLKNFTANLNYRYTIRGSNQTNRNYDQNLVGLQLTYSPR